VSPLPRPEVDPIVIAELFARHVEVHPYGLADLDEPYWSTSRWWRRGDAVVGEIGLPGWPAPVVYAVSATDPDRTTALLAELAVGELPPRFVITGPSGLGARLAATHEVLWSAPHHKFHLAHPDRLAPADGAVVALSTTDAPDLERLFATDPEAGDFFHPGLLESGFYRGVRVDGRLVAAAGIHVISRTHRVAAVGNVATHTGHRRRGLARATVAAVCRALLDEVDVIGLNVKDTNVGACALYRSMGFEPAIGYDEAELLRRGS
jgi:ribosomal protein S18 acetylase RimI-like enzyme